MSGNDTARPITHMRVLRIAAPIMISNMTVPMLGAVDTAVIGQMGETAPIGAVALGSTILTMMYWVFGFLRMGTTGLAAQAHGAGDIAERDAVLWRGLAVAAFAGSALILLQWPLGDLTLSAAGSSEEVNALTRTYTAIRIFAAPATIAVYAISGWLIAVERTRALLMLQLCISGFNAVFSLWFVLGLGWGVEGVALATLIAEWLGLAIGLWVCRAAVLQNVGPTARRFADRSALRRMFSVNRDIMIRSVILQLSITTFVFVGARFGDAELAANQVLMQLLTIAAFALDGISFTAESLVGQAVGQRGAAGRGRSDHLRQAAHITILWAAGAAVLISVAFAFFGLAIIHLLATSEELRATAQHYLPWLIAAPILSAAGYIFDGIFIGATMTRQMMQTMIISVAVYVLSLFILVPGFGNHGLWAALMLLNITRGATMYYVWSRWSSSHQGI
jgi:MATE family multidrug resistance protein